MNLFRHILVPVDFGGATEPAIRLALSIAQDSGARVTLLHAFDVTPFASASPFAAPIDLEPILAGAERELHALCERTRAKYALVDSVFRQGIAYEAVVEGAQALGCDLIVIGTHGRRGLSRAFLGSVAERVVRLSTIPVLTVRPSAAQVKAAAA